MIYEMSCHIQDTPLNQKDYVIPTPYSINNLLDNEGNGYFGSSEYKGDY